MYQALYRQYRPKTFDEVLGQEHITRTLRQQVLKGNIGHAYLFSGTRGTGKTSAAKILSRAVNCLNPQNGNPCNECEICKGILDESIMDVIEMDAASNNSVDDVRDLKEKVIYPPSRARFKVYIIDEVHMLSKGAFNALLKTLEEPPKHLIFILATTEPERLPQTILSRCQRFDFKRITNKDIVLNMKNITDGLNVEIEDKVLSLIARNSDGAMRDALSLLDQCISFNNEKISYEDATNILGMANKYIIFDMVNNINNKDLQKTLFAIDDIIQNGKDINQFIKDLIRHYRDLMVAKSSRNPMELIETEDTEDYIEQSKGMSLEYILKTLDVLSHAESQAKWSSQPRIILEMAAIKLVSIEEELSLEERIKRLEEGMIPGKPDENFKPAQQRPAYSMERPESNISTQKPPEQKPVENKLVENKDEKSDSQHKATDQPKDMANDNISPDGYTLTFDRIHSEWPKILQNIKAKKINIYALIMEGQLISFENELLTIAYDDGFGFHKEAVSAQQNKEFVEDIVSKYFNRNISIHFYMKAELPSKAFNADNKSEKEEVIKNVIEFFGEENVEVK